MLGLPDLSSGCKSIENKWIIKIKGKGDGLITKYKAHLKVRRYIQKECRL